MNKLKFTLAARLPLYMLVAVLMMVHSCKNKKKLTDISDTETVAQELEGELGEENAETQLDTSWKNENTSGKSSTQLDSRKKSTSELLMQQLNEIRNASSFAQANQSIEKAMQYFSGKNVPVLIILFEEGQTVEYDEPTTIEKYLNYLKDTKNKPAAVAEMVTDDDGKIKELVLRKQ